MQRSRRIGRRRSTLIVLVLASLTILTLDYRDTAPMRGLRRGAATVFSPVRGVGDAIASPFRNGWSGLTRYDELEDENARLRRRLDKVEGAQIETEAARREVQDLKRQLEIKFIGDIPTRAARVVSGPLTNFTSTVEIDRGAGDGVKKGMAVVTDAGLVGRVLRVTGGRSQVELITDPAVAVGVRLVLARDVGTAVGDGRAGTLSVETGIQLESSVRRGEAVVTSGLDRSPFPGDVPVGRVRSVRQTDDRTEQEITITPAADLDGLTYVTVLLCDNDCN